MSDADQQTAATNTQPLHPKIAARAQAIAEVTRMEEEITALHDENERITRDLHRAEDRVQLVLEERDRFRRDATIYRDCLVELATAMSNIGLMTIKAGEIMKTVKELTKDSPAESLGMDAVRAAMPKDTQ